MKTKRFNGSVKQTSDTGEVQAVFATMGVIDHDGDVIQPGAFGVQNTAFLFAHNAHDIPLGKARIFEEGNEAIADIKINMDIERGREVHSALKFDMENGEPLQEFSFGFDVVDGGFGEFEGEKVRFLKALKVHEVSPVLLGAGVNTRTRAVKHKGGPGKPVKFADQLMLVIAETEDIAARAVEIHEMRMKQGRQMSNERRGQMLDLIQAQKSLAATIAQLEQAEQADVIGLKAYEEFAQWQTAHTLRK